MGFMARWRERRNLNNPAVPLTSAAILQHLGAGNVTTAGVDVTEQNSMRNMAVWRAVNLIAGTVALLPLKVYRDTPGGSRREVRAALFEDPIYPGTTWFEFLETQVLHILLGGNAYALKIRNEGGDKIVRLLPILPEQVSVERIQSTVGNPSGKIFHVQGVEDPFTDPEILHIPGLSYDGLTGLSPIGQARQAVGVAIAAEEVAGRLFDSGMLMGGILQSELELSNEDAAKVKQRWRERTAGVARAYEINILANGFKFLPAQIPPKDAEWLDTRRFGIEEIARLYGVPADLLMENRATGNTNVEDRAQAWVRFGLNAWTRRIEKRLSMELLPRGQFCEFNLDGLLKGDSATEAEVFASAITNKWMTPDEVRAIKNLPPLTQAQKDELSPPAPLTFTELEQEPTEDEE